MQQLLGAVRLQEARRQHEVFTAVLTALRGAEVEHFLATFRSREFLVFHRDPSFGSTISDDPVPTYFEVLCHAGLLDSHDDKYERLFALTEAGRAFVAFLPLQGSR